MIVDHICVNFGAPLFHELFLALDKCQLEQNVFYPRNTKHRRIDKETPYQLDSPLVLNFITKISFSKKRLILQQEYDSLFQRNKPDMIHAHTLFSDGSLAYHYYKNYDTPFIVAVRSTDIDVFLKYKPWLRRYARQILDHAGKIIFISPSLKKRFLEIFGMAYEAKSVIIPNGIHPFYLNTGESRKRNIHTPLELLYVGSFLKRKKVPALINAIENSEARLSIVGAGGVEEKKVLRMIRHSDKVKYLGRIEDRSDLAQLYQQSDIFIMTSQGETFGLVYLESMSQGLPVIYSKDTGIDGFFEQGSIGYGVSPGSASEIKEGINRITANYQEISRNCITEARKLNWPGIAKSYFDIYNLTISQSVEQERL